MRAVLTIKSLMTRSPITIEGSEPIENAQKLMAEGHIRHLPVTSNGRAISVITDRDINLALLANRGLSGGDALTFEDVCTLQTYSVEPDTPLDQVVTYMAEQHIGSVLITENNSLAGIFTATDACRYLGECLRDNLKAPE
ncbi:MAG: CBS domain-containing protein [Sedimenticola sp.]